MRDERFQNIAVYIDYENFALGMNSYTHTRSGQSYQKLPEMQKVLERIVEKGRICIKRAYCDWNRFSNSVTPLHELGIELIQIPDRVFTGKNSADIRLAVDATEVAFTRDYIETFVICSGDSDFSPLVSKLKERGKHVIGVGMKDATSSLLVGMCDEFIFYEDVLRIDAPEFRGTVEEDKEPAYELLFDAIEALQRDDVQKLHASILKDFIRRKRPDFSELTFGYRNFTQLLHEAADHGLIELGYDEAAGTYYVDSFVSDDDRRNYHGAKLRRSGTSRRSSVIGENKIQQGARRSISEKAISDNNDLRHAQSAQAHTEVSQTKSDASTDKESRVDKHHNDEQKENVIESKKPRRTRASKKKEAAVQEEAANNPVAPDLMPIEIPAEGKLLAAQLLEDTSSTSLIDVLHTVEESLSQKAVQTSTQDKPRRGRPRKKVLETPVAAESLQEEKPEREAETPAAPVAKRRGRPRKQKLDDAPQTPVHAPEPMAEDQDANPKKRRGRPRKEQAAQAQEHEHSTQQENVPQEQSAQVTPPAHAEQSAQNSVQEHSLSPISEHVHAADVVTDEASDEETAHKAQAVPNKKIHKVMNRRGRRRL